MRIDAHQHFWKFDPVRDSWIINDMAVIQRDFMPEDLQQLLVQNGFDGCVAVQADQSEEQTEFLIGLANNFSFIKGVVGWVDLQADNIKERLEHFQHFKIVKGFRHVLQGEAQRDFMLRPAFMKGIAALRNYNFTYDILIYEDQLQYIPEFVSAFPDQRFVIDHLAKPAIKKRKIEDWKKAIATVAQFENVYCKLSGLVTEADWKGWRKEDFTPYLDVVADAFGPNRIMFGSDWPVCLVAAEYGEVVSLVDDYFSAYTQNEKQKIFGGNAAAFYQL